jgi:thiol-disulfide isomerase/thioredoxin
MIKRFVILLAAALVTFNCVSAFAQEEEPKPEYYVGLFTPDEILQHDEQYADIAFTYIPDEEALAVFKAVAEPVTIKLFYRTNCPDSVREVPPFIKTIQLADNPNITVEAVGVNRAKDEPADLVAGWDIQRVPTFIVVHNGQEIGRVIETSRVKIEVDLAEFLGHVVK